MGTDDPLAEALRKAYAALSPEGVERFPLKLEWEPLSHVVGTDKPQQDQGVKATVPAVPTVPTNFEYIQHCTPEEALAAWDERAAIREFDGGMSRETAEELTTCELGPRPRS